VKKPGRPKRLKNRTTWALPQEKKRELERQKERKEGKRKAEGDATRGESWKVRRMGEIESVKRM